MSHNIKVPVYFGSKQFFDALVQLKSSVVQGTAYCNRLIASRLNLEFSFNGKKEVCSDGSELLRKALDCAKEGSFTQEDADFAVAQLSRIGLVYNSMRTLYHLQYVEDAKVKAENDGIPLVDTPNLSDDNTEIQKMVEVNIQEEKPVVKRGRKK